MVSLSLSSSLFTALPQDWSVHLPDWPHGQLWQALAAMVDDGGDQDVYPPMSAVFLALRLTPFEKVRVVILGQDPYHGQGQAHGLAFSVPHGVTMPPSLKNIFKEYSRDLGYPVPKHGCLQTWAQQGVLLLNSSLTVSAGQAGSHRHYGWENMTSSLIGALAQHHKGLIFLLWGSQAQKICQQLDLQHHHVLCAPHPSPLSAYRGFLGCGHFSAVNQILSIQGREPVNWQLFD